MPPILSRRAPEELRALVVGMGSIGQRHLSLLRSAGVQHIVVQTRRPAAVRVATGAVVATTMDEALRSDPDLVLVCTTANLRIDAALAAVRQGCHLFVEKPLANSMTGVEELRAVVQATGVTAVAGFDMRFDPGLCQVKTWIDGGRIGRVLSIQAQVGQYLPDWRPGRNYWETASARNEWGGGAIFELTHELDYVSWLVGHVDTVSCLSAKVSDLRLDVEDVAIMTLAFASGAVGSVHVDFLQRVPTRTCRVIGELGSVEWDHQARTASLRLPDASQNEDFSYRAFERDDRFAAQMAHLLACVAGTSQPRADLNAAIDNLRLALGAKLAASTSRAVHLQCVTA